MNFDNFLTLDNIEILDEATHKDVIEKLIDMIKASGKIAKIEELKESIYERERIISTGIGLGLAIPHARNESIKEFTMAALLVREGVEWKSIDDKNVNFIVLVASPTHTHKEYLEILAQIVLLWKDELMRKKILAASNKKEIFDCFKNLNKTIY